jgi:hypothetical protein
LAGDDALLTAINRTLLIIGYGSLLSGYGLLSERRGGASCLIALNAFPVRLLNARRGLAKPTGHGRYLAMDLEPIDPAAPISANIQSPTDCAAIDSTGSDATSPAVKANAISGAPIGRASGIGALGLVFDRDTAPLIARREEYDAAKLTELLDRADRAGLPLGDFLMPLARHAGFNLLAYRRALRDLLGYTSPGYIFHPLPLDDGRIAIVAIGSGFDGSGDPLVQSKRARYGMDRLLTLSEAVAHPTFDMDPIGQTGYYLECVLGGYHGLDVSDLITALRPALDAQAAASHLAFAARIAAIVPGERERFMRATSLDEDRYVRGFGTAPHGSLARLMATHTTSNQGSAANDLRDQA